MQKIARALEWTRNKSAAYRNLKVYSLVRSSYFGVGHGDRYVWVFLDYYSERDEPATEDVPSYVNNILRVSWYVAYNSYYCLLLVVE